MTTPREIPTRVERDVDFDGKPNGRYVFVIDDLHHFYDKEFDADAMEWQLENAGYVHRQFRPLIRRLEQQFDELTAPPSKPSAQRGRKPATAKPDSTDEEPPPAEEPAAGGEAAADNESAPPEEPPAAE